MTGALAYGLAVACGSSGPPPEVIPNTTLPGVGGTPGAGGGGGGDGGEDAGFDAGVDAGGEACDGGCLQLGQECQPDEINGGCAPGLTCLIDLNTGITYTCQGPGGDF